MAEEPQRRVIVADARGDGHFLRVTWHPELGQFVVSQWRDDTCVASTRLSPDAASEVLALLVRGLATGPGVGAAPGDVRGRGRRGGDAGGQAGTK